MSLRDEIRTALVDGSKTVDELLPACPAFDNDRTRLAQHMAALATEGKVRRAGLSDDGKPVYQINAWPSVEQVAAAVARTGALPPTTLEQEPRPRVEKPARKPSPAKATRKAAKPKAKAVKKAAAAKKPVATAPAPTKRKPAPKRPAPARKVSASRKGARGSLKGKSNGPHIKVHVDAGAGVAQRLEQLPADMREAVERARVKIASVREAASANAIQIGGAHYKGLDPQPWDVIQAWGLGFLDGNVVKYVARCKDKGGIEDLKKARHYLDKLIETFPATA